ncbi:MAG: tRNA guanosine(34) transglycosylase Tgt [Planctomycetota bacterium]|jgi:queuine tRNA-ribosyltransferase
MTPPAAPDSFGFELRAVGGGGARAGTVRTAHGAFDTPCFMAVGTQGAAKSLSPDQLRASGVEVLLANAYHLALRPGAETVRALGGLHGFARWDGPTLTDSGGFQIWSLKGLSEISEEGARFRSHLDGSEHFFTPEGVIRLEETLGADMIMPLDECLEYPAERDRARLSAERTVRWAERSRASASGACALFGIVQGGSYPELRVWSAERLVEMGFAGYAVGGLSVGEGPLVFREVLSCTLPVLPAEKPRYLMGVGEPEDLLKAVELGADMFDCVLPTRNGRRGQAFTGSGKIRLRNARFREDAAVIEPGCDCPACAGGFTRGYLRHLFSAGEVLGGTLVSAHNLRFFTRLTRAAREAIEAGRFAEWKAEWLEAYGAAEAA